MSNDLPDGLYDEMNEAVDDLRACIDLLFVGRSQNLVVNAMGIAFVEVLVKVCDTNKEEESYIKEFMSCMQDNAISLFRKKPDCL